MKLFLFGGAEISLGQFLPQLKLIEQVIKDLGVKQVLHIPFARTIAKEVERSGDWFNKHIHVNGLEYLNATNDADIAKANNPIIFISGGGENINLMKEINNRPTLLGLIRNATYFIGESAGSIAIGEYLRMKKDNVIIQGLGLLKNTIIEPHYSERNYQQILENDMKETGMLYGIGIDCCTAMVFDLNEFPDTYTKIGDGLVEIKTNPSTKK